jgi:hypothetical protein
MAASSRSRNFLSVAAMRDRPLDPIALDLMQRATVAQLRDDATELAALCRGLDGSTAGAPPLSLDPHEREMQLVKLFRAERERSRLLLTLLSG